MPADRSGERRALEALARAGQDLVDAPIWRLVVDDPASPWPELISCPDYQWVSTAAVAPPPIEPQALAAYPWLAEYLADDEPATSGGDSSWELMTGGALYLNQGTLIDLDLLAADLSHRDLTAVIGGRVLRWRSDSTVAWPREDWATQVQTMFGPRGDDRAVIVAEDDQQLRVRFVQAGEVVWGFAPASDPVFVLEKAPTGIRLSEVRDIEGRLLNHLERLTTAPPCPVDVDTLDVLDAEEAVRLLHDAYPRSRPRPPRRRPGAAALHLLAPDEPDQTWSLTSYDLPTRMRSDAVTLDRTVAGLFRGADSDLAGAIELDSEGGMFCARASDPADLRRLAALIKNRLVSGAELA